MEIEAKFSFSEPSAFAGWLTRPRLGPFALGPARLLRLTDSYLDTDDRACLRQGYACRVRLEGERAIATLKSLEDQQQGGDGVRRRDEQEVDLPAPPSAAPTTPGEIAPDWQQPNAWPEGPARALALRLSGGRLLRGLATLWQERHERPVRDAAGRVIASLTLDRVSFADGAPSALELECELTKDGDEQAMAEIVAALRREHTFTPEPRSKLARALQGMELPAGARAALTGEQRGEEQSASARARTAPTAQQPGDGDTNKASPGTERLEGRPADAKPHAASSGDAPRAVAPPEAAPNLAADGPASADEPATRIVLALAEATPVVPSERAERLRRALALLDEGRHADADAPSAAARDIAAARQPDADTAGPLLLGALALLALLDERADGDGVARRLGGHRARALPALASLGANDAAEARVLALLLHLGGALAAAGVERIAAATVSEPQAAIYLDGPFDGDNSLEKRCAALWREAFDADLALHPAGAARKIVGLRYDMPLADAGRRILAARLAQLQAGLDGLHNDADVEALHDARVAARRMRSAFKLLKDAFPRREARPLARTLRSLARALGEVRDLDVLIARVRADARTHQEEDALAPTLARMTAERSRVRSALLAEIDAPEHAAWLTAMQVLIDGETRGEKGERRLCDAVPALLWRGYGRVRAYAPGIERADNTRLHELRKETRRLRYALEFFQELLDTPAGDLIDQTVALQDALGALHDSVALHEALQRFGAPEPALLRTLADLTRGRQASLSLWPTVHGRTFREALGEACAAL